MEIAISIPRRMETPGSMWRQLFPSNAIPRTSFKIPSSGIRNHCEILSLYCLHPYEVSRIVRTNETSQALLMGVSTGKLADAGSSFWMQLCINTHRNVKDRGNNTYSYKNLCPASKVEVPWKRVSCMDNVSPDGDGRFQPVMCGST